jgi:HAD superfamily hydrolase (TIGR01509 family)
MSNFNSETQRSVIEAALCDLDGTLVDSNSLHATAWKEAFGHFGIEVSFDAALHQIGKGGDQLIPVFVPNDQLEALAKPIEEYRKRIFEEKYFHKIKPFPGARDLLIKMNAAGLRVAISSSASKKDLSRLKELAKIDDLVEEETSTDDAEQSKPSPDIFQATLHRLGLEPERTLALGDTPWDVEAARKAGVMTVAVISGGWTREELARAGALEIYQDVSHLANEFDNSAFCRGRFTAA